MSEPPKKTQKLDHISHTIDKFRSSAKDPPPEFMIRLASEKAPVEQKLTAPFYVIGREPIYGHPLIADPRPNSSRQHALLFFDGTAWNIVDVSSNGTALAGELMDSREAYTLNDGDSVRFVNTRSPWLFSKVSTQVELQQQTDTAPPTPPSNAPSNSTPSCDAFSRATGTLCAYVPTIHSSQTGVSPRNPDGGGGLSLDQAKEILNKLDDCSWNSQKGLYWRPADIHAWLTSQDCSIPVEDGWKSVPLPDLRVSLLHDDEHVTGRYATCIPTSRHVLRSDLTAAHCYKEGHCKRGDWSELTGAWRRLIHGTYKWLELKGWDYPGKAKVGEA
eukprot:TRINITY_DN17493_c0_g1_i1.p1 TRINITY_DN17493_c0_g1~~TRINITY_DN17493_c0_g1_i1.p1  ORF type:complete len:331 (+),score=5.59 TRINITY_DN17493_c0_g1_i1:68-1060(+)